MGSFERWGRDVVPFLLVFVSALASGCSSSSSGDETPAGDDASSAHDGSVHDGATHDARARDSAQHDGPLHDSAAHDGSDRDVSTHDASVRDALVDDGSMDDGSAHDASADGARDGSSGDDALAPDAGPKTPMAGLVDMQTITWNNTEGQPDFVIGNANQFPGVLGGIVINATWGDLQPSQTGALDYSTVDGALADVRTYNEANPSAPLAVKLRVYGAANAPDWAKAIGGPLTIMRNSAGCSTPPCNLTIGAYWTADYIAAWRAFQGLLAARYDSEPLIRQVAVTSCGSQTDEPFVSTTNAASRTTLTTAGLTDALQQACLSGAVDDYAAWKQTLIDFTFNTYVKVAGGGTDAAFTTTVMNACRASLGARCVLDNHALAFPPEASDATVYATMQTLGGPINFQTQSPAGFGCEWTDTVAQGVQFGASAIELWPDTKFHGFDTLTTPELEQLAAEFTAPIALPDAGTLPDGGACPGFH